MHFQRNQLYHQFKLVSDEEIEEIEGRGRIFKHEISGVTLIQLEAKDVQKVMTVAFSTPPESDQGTPHIIEHTVCCSSEKYPVKETLLALEKGSVCTTLNACTYPDMTMYYAASSLEKDLLGIGEVLLDLVFHPQMLKDPLLFRQEGWRYALERTNGPLTYNGIVYHEMKGEYAQPTTRLEQEINKALFPDTPYQYDSGGVPEHIVTLTEETLLDFYHNHYDPSQCVICLYGDMDIDYWLKVLDEQCLKGLVGSQKAPAQIPLQQVLPAQRLHTYYPAAKKDQEAKTFLSLSYVIGPSENPELRLAFELLEHMLLRSNASPLAKALIIEGGLGISMGEGGFDTGKRQSVFSIILKGSEAKAALLFEQKVREVLENLIKEGIPRELIESALHTLSFELREVDAGYEPIGIQYSEMVLSNYFYGGEPFAHLRYKAPLEAIRRLQTKGYFEALIDQYLLKNTHYVLTILEPSAKLLKEERLHSKSTLKTYERSLSKEMREQLVKETKALKKMQEQPVTKEALALLPKLTKEDLSLEVIPIEEEKYVIDQVPVTLHFENTKEIVYIHLLFDTTVVKEEEVPYMSLLAHMLTYVGAGDMDYAVVENAINSITGGVNSSLSAYTYKGGTAYKPLLKITSKVLVEELEPFSELMDCILTSTHFKEKEKIREIIGTIKYELESSAEGAPEYRAIRRLYAYFSPAGLYEDHVCGLSFYHFIAALYEDFDLRYEALKNKLIHVYEKLLSKQNASVYMTLPKTNKQLGLQCIERIVRGLRNQVSQKENYYFVPLMPNEAYCTSQDVQAIAKGFHYGEVGFTYSGSLELTCNLLENTYLWDKVRLEGGAYGCDVLLSRDGYIAFCSYCDPQLTDTVEAYDTISTYLKSLTLDEEEIERYIINTIGMLQMPLSMGQKSERALTYALCGMQSTDFETTLKEIYETTLDDIRGHYKLFERFKEKASMCVFGSEEVITKEKTLFSHIIEF